jgi:hypothetical protein
MPPPGGDDEWDAGRRCALHSRINSGFGYRCNQGEEYWRGDNEALKMRRLEYRDFRFALDHLRRNFLLRCGDYFEIRRIS